MFVRVVCGTHFADLLAGFSVLITALLGGTEAFLFSEIYHDLQEVPEIPDGATIVYLDRNQIRDVKPGAFSNLAVCDILSLEHNKLTVVRADMWEGLTSLRLLFLNYNQISEISPGAFSTLPAVSGIGIQDNNLSALEAEMFTEILSLKELSLYHNPIISQSNH